MNKPFNMRSLDGLKVHSTFITELPGDPVRENYTRQVSQACYSLVTPKAFPNASLIASSQDLMLELGLNPAESGNEAFTRVFSGTSLLEGMVPYACCYGGHQFGNWAGQLGDGRAINLGELKAPDGQFWTLQLKGAGPTPYSRSADGLAVLRSSVREFLCSEAMYHLGVPTTRALSLVGTGESVVRDIFYDGHPRYEPGAVVCRAAPTFTRFGSFEIFAARGDQENLKKLADYTLRQNFPHLGEPGKETYMTWFREVCVSTAGLIVHWMRVGFVHGVMNTDNMSIIGQTIDYGPYGWLENYDPEWTPNTTDAQGRRYRFGNQAKIALWNLLQLANAIYPLIGEAQGLEDALEEFKNTYEQEWLKMMQKKLGLSTQQSGDESLCLSLISTFGLAETDMTIFFRHLANIERQDSAEQALAKITPAFYAEQLSEDAHTGFIQWFEDYLARLNSETVPDEERHLSMNMVNPLYVLRNYLAQLAIDKAEQGDYSGIHELMEVLKTPYTDQEGKDHLVAKRPEWARTKPGCSMLSCSS